MITPEKYHIKALKKPQKTTQGWLVFTEKRFFHYTSANTSAIRYEKSLVSY